MCGEGMFEWPRTEGPALALEPSPPAGVELGLQSRVLFIAVFRRHRGSDCPRHGAQTSDRATCSARSRALPPRGALPTLRFLAVFLAG